MLTFVITLLGAIRPFLGVICLISAWLILALLVLSVWRFVTEGWARVRYLHQIPCSGCQFFTGDYRLKCTIHPAIANSEEAIYCADFLQRKGIRG